jgi:predicted nucleotidyltransferase component of viral defense system
MFQSMDVRQVRRLVITAIFSDDYLVDLLVLKGGNALDLIYRIGQRSSLDVDLSLEEDFTDVSEASQRLIRALRDRFESAGRIIFDERFERRPSEDSSKGTRRWGGYQLTFKITTREKQRAAKDDASLRRTAEVIGDSQERIFRIQISKYEYTRHKQFVVVDDYTIPVYTPEMIAIEKLRAICQQMQAYRGRTATRTARARDFYDIHSIITAEKVDLCAAENVDLLRNIFAAKDVPIELLQLIGDERDFHATDWPAVQAAVKNPLEDFDFYFTFVVRLAADLKP